MSRVRKHAPALVTATCTLLLATAPAHAQEPADPNPGALTVTGSFDVLNRYMFRGIQQNNTGVAMWPALDLGFGLYSGDGGLKSVGLNVGTWNSLHTGNTGSDNSLNGKLWYESDFYTTLGFGFGGGTSLGITYTAYTSPNTLFTTVKEFMFKFGVDDSAALGKASFKPYIIIAQEFGSEIGTGQADAGDNAGTYMEIGAAPGYSGSRASIAFPLKVGFSLSDYYELAGEDNKFGFFSVAAIATIPLGGTTSFGSWNLHGGVEYQALGTTTEALNGGESNQVIGSIGIGFSY